MNVNSINKFKEVVDSNFSREKIDAKKSKNQTLEDVAKDFESFVRLPNDEELQKSKACWRSPF